MFYLCNLSDTVSYCALNSTYFELTRFFLEFLDENKIEHLTFNDCIFHIDNLDSVDRLIDVDVKTVYWTSDW